MWYESGHFVVAPILMDLSKYVIYACMYSLMHNEFLIITEIRDPSNRYRKPVATNESDQ